MIGVIAKALNLRLNRRYFWIGLGVTAGVTGLMAHTYPWMLNGGFVLPWILLHGARLHDLGGRGVWSVVVVVSILALLTGLAVTRPPTGVYGGAVLLAFLAIASFSLFAGVRRGDPQANKFGPAPTGWALGYARRGADL